MSQFLSTESIVIELLLVVTVVALVVRRFNIPYTVALVVVGLYSHYNRRQVSTLHLN